MTILGWIFFVGSIFVISLGFYVYTQDKKERKQ